MSDNSKGPQQSGNGKASVISALLTGDNKVIALLILLSGGANLFETNRGTQFNAVEIQRATTEIHELYPRLIQALNNQNEIMESNTRLLRNQTDMLESQRKSLDILQSEQRRLFGGGTNHP